MEPDPAGVLHCRPGDMGTSALVERQLRAWAEGQDETVRPFPFRVGGRWHCLTDGTRMREADGVITCPACDRSLPNRLVYLLVEFHQHRPAVG